MDDVLESPDRDLPCDLMVSKALPKQAITTYVLLFEYLTGAGLGVNGKWVSKATVNKSVKARADRYEKGFVKLKSPTKPTSVADLEVPTGWEGVSKDPLKLPTLTSDVDGLRLPDSSQGQADTALVGNPVRQGGRRLRLAEVRQVLVVGPTRVKRSWR